MNTDEEPTKNESVETWQVINSFTEPYAFSNKGRLRRLPQKVRLANGRVRVIPGEMIKPNMKDGLYWINMVGNTRICLSPKHLAEGKVKNVKGMTVE